jgi:hypothetical protein
VRIITIPTATFTAVRLIASGFIGTATRGGLAGGLPGRIDFDLRHSVALTMETDRPYIYHEKVVTYYAPDYFQRVKIKEDHDKATDHDKGDGPGSDNGKGNGKKK